MAGPEVGVEVRQLRADEAERYTALRRELLTDTPRAFGSTIEEDTLQDAEQVRKWCAHAELGIFVAADGDSGELLSTAVFVREGRTKTRHRAEVIDVFTRPSARGRGLARRVVECALDHARALDGVELVSLGVSDTTPNAQRVYERIGFEVYGRMPRAVLIDGVASDEILMSIDVRSRVSR